MIPIRSLLADDTSAVPTARSAAAGRKRSPVCSFTDLPPELRLGIWSCAVEPRIVIFNDLIKKLRAYPIPSVTQLNAEARIEYRQGYEPVGRGSYLNFSHDILVCDPGVLNQNPDRPMEELAQRIKKLAFWDCLPDDGRVKNLHNYSVYSASTYSQRGFGSVEFDQFLFPNVKDLWVVKVGKVDRSWGVRVEWPYYEKHVQETARQFRYWRDDNVIEIAPLNIDDPDTKAVLRKGRCREHDCRKLTRGASKVVSKITFMRGPYRRIDDGADWVRILPWPAAAAADGAKDSDTAENRNRMRWMMVERILTFSLHHAHESLAEARDGDSLEYQP